MVTAQETFEQAVLRLAKDNIQLVKSPPHYELFWTNPITHNTERMPFSAFEVLPTAEKHFRQYITDQLVKL